MKLINADSLCDFFCVESEDVTEFINDVVMNYPELEIDYSDECRALCRDLIKGVINVIKTEPAAFDLDAAIDGLQKSKLYSAVNIIKREIK